jgi:hypothetical protein
VQIGSFIQVIEEIGPQNGISDVIVCPCACHTLGLAINDGLPAEIVDQLKEAVELLRSKPIVAG